MYTPLAFFFISISGPTKPDPNVILDYAQEILYFLMVGISYSLIDVKFIITLFLRFIFLMLMLVNRGLRSYAFPLLSSLFRVLNGHWTYIHEFG